MDEVIAIDDIGGRVFTLAEALDMYIYDPEEPVKDLLENLICGMNDEAFRDLAQLVTQNDAEAIGRMIIRATFRGLEDAATGYVTEQI